MKKHKIVSSFLVLFFLLITTGCTHSNDTTAIISVNADSEYGKTFEDLHLGVLYDFDYKLLDADKSWVNLWVEKYQDGEKDPQHITQLSFGLSPNKKSEGNIGFGMINPDSQTPQVFLYAPSVRSHPEIIEPLNTPDTLIGWDYAIGDEKLELEYGKTYTLAVYRQTLGESIRSGYDYQDEKELENVLKEHSLVLLLKIKIEEKVD